MERLNTEDRIKQQFEFIHYLTQYSEDGIRIDPFEIKKGLDAEYKDFRNTEGETIAFAPTTILDQEGNKESISYSPGNGVERELVSRFYKKHFEEECKKHAGLEEDNFIKYEIKFLNGFHDSIKEEYRYIIDPLMNFLEASKDKGLNAFINKQSPTWISMFKDQGKAGAILTILKSDPLVKEQEESKILYIVLFNVLKEAKILYTPTQEEMANIIKETFGVELSRTNFSQNKLGRHPELEHHFKKILKPFLSL